MSDKINVLIVGQSPFLSSGWGLQLQKQSRGIHELDNVIVSVLSLQKESIPEKEDKSFANNIFVGLKDLKTGRMLKEDLLGKMSIPKLINDLNIKIIVTNGDLWLVDFIPSLKQRDNVVWIHYFGIETNVLPNIINQSVYSKKMNLKTIINNIDYLVVYTDMQKKLLKENFNKDCIVINLATDIDLYKKFVPSEEQLTELFSHLDHQLSIKDLSKYNIITSQVCRNQPRKQIGITFDTIAKLKKKGYNPLHFQWSSTKGHYDIISYREHFKLNDNIFWLKEGVISNYMPEYTTLSVLYNLIDLYISPHGAEGWGLPILDAMACGTKVCVTDYAGPKTYLNEDLLPDEDTNLFKLQKIEPKLMVPWIGSANIFAIVDANEYADRIELLYNNKDDTLSVLNQKVANMFTWQKYQEEWKNLISRIIEEYYG